jgi:hypothetical protein
MNHRKISKNNGLFQMSASRAVGLGDDSGDDSDDDYANEPPASDKEDSSGDSGGDSDDDNASEPSASGGEDANDDDSDDSDDSDDYDDSDDSDAAPAGGESVAALPAYKGTVPCNDMPCHAVPCLACWPSRCFSVLWCVQGSTQKTTQNFSSSTIHRSSSFA